MTRANPCASVRGGAVDMVSKKFGKSCARRRAGLVDSRWKFGPRDTVAHEKGPGASTRSFI